jgi:uncharacterized protein (TIGR00725 family)
VRPVALAIVGPAAAATADDTSNAESLGRLAASERWIVVSGGMAAGVMEAASRGASVAGGTVVGILPSSDWADATPYLSVAIVTGMGQARNNVVVLSSDAVVVCGASPGAMAEAALALRSDRPVVFVGATPVTRAFFEQFESADIRFVDSPEKAIAELRSLFAARGSVRDL